MTPEIVKKTFIWGTSGKVAAHINEYSANGGKYHVMADITPAMAPTNPEQVIDRYIEVCRLLKQSCCLRQCREQS